MLADEIAIEVRPRDGFEAVDLGFQLARSIFRPLFGAHAIVLGTVAFALYAALHERIWLAGLFVWWLKPLYDRIALYVLAEALFGRVPTVLETLAAVPRLLVTTGLGHSLTWLRFTPLRAFTLPVLQLEGLRGSARSERARVLVGRNTRAALGLFFACGAFELVVFGAGLQLVATFRPEGDALAFWAAALRGEGMALSWLEALLYVLAVAAIEPLYVAGGFALYVNRRVWLEGWDVELAFRKLARRLAPAGAALLIALAVAAPGARADEPEPEAPQCVEWGPQGAAACLEAVLATDEFSTVEKVELWLPKVSEPEEVEVGALGQFAMWLAALASALLRIGAWLLLALFLGVLALVLVRALRERERTPVLRPVAPNVRFGLDLRPEALPDDVIAAARAQFAAGNAQAALSLLYRGALVYLVRAAGLRIPDSATERECERAAGAVLDPALARDFSALTRAWVFCAYGHQAPAADAFAELCERWTPHLGARA